MLNFHYLSKLFIKMPNLYIVLEENQKTKAARILLPITNLNGPLDNENFYVIFCMFLIGVIAVMKYNGGLKAHKLMLEALSQIHSREFKSWFSSEHADRMETL